MDKDKIQGIADRLAEEQFGCDLYALPEDVRFTLWGQAEQEYIDNLAAQVDAAMEKAKYHGIPVIPTDLIGASDSNKVTACDSDGIV